MKKNLILSIAVNYSYKKIRVFIESLEKTSFNGDFVLFYNNLPKRTIKILQRKRILLIPFDSRDFEKKKLSVVRYRFILFYNFLKEHYKEYNKVFLADIRDVFFQEDIFDYPTNKSLNFFLESQIIKNCKLNSEILLSAAGEKGFKKYCNKKIICAGTTLGNAKHVLFYLSKMVENLFKAKEDQGLHNFLIYSRNFKDTKLFQNFEGPVLTLGYIPEKNLLLNQEGELINKNGKVIPALHQYDRYPSLVQKFNAPKPNQFAAFLARKFKFLSKLRKFLFKVPLIKKPFIRFYQKFT